MEPGDTAQLPLPKCVLPSLGSQAPGPRWRWQQKKKMFHSELQSKLFFKYCILMLFILNRTTNL